MGASGPQGWVTVPPAVSVRAFPDQAVLLNVDTGRYHGLDATGSVFWEVIQHTGSRSEAVGALSDRFAADAEKLGADLDRFCEELEERGLIALRRE